MLILMSRYIICISYFNSKLSGIANDNNNSILKILYKNLLLHMSNIYYIKFSSRTDKHVSAKTQYIFFFSNKKISNMHTISQLINKHINCYNIFIKYIDFYNDDYIAIKKEYHYYISRNNLSLYTVNKKSFCLFYFVRLCYIFLFDEFLGKNLISFEILQSNHFLILKFTGYRFFYHQIRKFIGSVIFFSQNKKIKKYRNINSAPSKFLILISLTPILKYLS